MGGGHLQALSPSFWLGEILNPKLTFLLTSMFSYTILLLRATVKLRVTSYFGLDTLLLALVPGSLDLGTV